MIRSAVIGLGDIANIHVPLLQQMENVSLVALCDIDASKQTLFNLNIPFYTDYQEMLKKEHIDVVHICLPHYLHFPITKYCAQKGIHVLQEKPLAISVNEAIQAAQLEKQVHVKLCLCLQNRKNASFQLCKKIMKEQTYGKLLGISASVHWARSNAYYSEKPWRGSMTQAGGGVMMNQSIHTLDLMQQLGGKISKVRGDISQLLDYDIEVEDTASACILFENGVKGYFHATNANCENDSVHMEVHFEHATLRMIDYKLYLLDQKGALTELIEDAVLSGPKSYYGAGHRMVFEEFYNAIKDDTQSYIHLHEGVVSMQMIDAICTSSRMKAYVKMED